MQALATRVSLEDVGAPPSDIGQVRFNADRQCSSRRLQWLAVSRTGKSDRENGMNG